MDARAVQAYTQAVNRAVTGVSSGGGDSAVAGPAGSGFSELLRDTIETSANALAEGERASAGAAAKKADFVDVVTAVTNAELTLQTVVAVRDKVIAAYQDIMRMPI